MKANLINGAESSVAGLFKNKPVNNVNSTVFSSTLEKVESKLDKKSVQDIKENSNKKSVEKNSKTSKEVDKKDSIKEEIKDNKKTNMNLDDVIAMLQSFINNTDVEKIDVELKKFLTDVEIDLDVETIQLVNSEDGLDLLKKLGLNLDEEVAEKLTPELLSDKLKEVVKLSEEKTDFKAKKDSNVSEADLKLDVEVSEQVKINPENKVGLEEESEMKTADLEKNQSLSTKSIRQMGREIEGEESSEVKIELENSEDSFVPILKDRINFNVAKEVKVEKPLELDQKQVIDQIVEKVRVDFTDNKNQIKLSLKPQTLGNMTMDIQLDKGDVVAKILVDNHRTKEIIESNLVQLKDGLRENGMNIKTVEVEVGNNADFTQNPEKKFNFNQNNRKFKNTNRIKINNNYEDNIIVEPSSNPNNPYEEDGFDIMA